MSPDSPARSAPSPSTVRHVCELAVLNEVGAICAAAQNFQDILAATTRALAKSLYPDHCGFLLLDSARNRLVRHESYVLSNPEIVLEAAALSTGLTGKVLRTGHPRRVGHVQLDPEEHATDPGSRSVLCLPLRDCDVVLGVLNIESPQPEAFSETDERLLITVLDLVSAAHQRLRKLEQIQVSETRYQSMLGCLPLGVYIHDGQQLFYANPMALRIFGADSVDQLKVIAPLDNVVPAFRHTVAQRIQTVLETKGQLPAVELQIYRLDKQVVDIEVHSCWAEYAGHECVQVQFTDITARKQAEEALRQSQQSLKSIAEATPHWIYVFDLDAMGTTYANRSLLLDLGHPPGSEQAERSIESFANFMPPSEWPHLARLPQEWAAMTDGQFRSDEYHVNHADGSVSSFLSREVIYARRADGTVKQILGTLTDITRRKQAEQALVQSEQRFRELADAIPQIIWIAGADGGLTHLNAKATEYTGIGTDQLTGWSWDKVIYPDDLAQTVADWKDCLEAGQPRDMAFRIRRADHTYRWHITRQVPVRNSAGVITTWYGTCTDIEDLKQAQASSQESELRFRLLFEGAADAIFWADADSGRITNCNRAAEMLLGWNRSEMIGRPQSFLHPSEEADHYRRLFREHTSRDFTTPVEVQVIRKDGQRVDVAITASVTVINGQQVIQGIFRNISQRKRDEQTIQKLSAFRETIIQTAAEGICVCRPVDVYPFVFFTVWNDRMTEITGYSIEEINRLGWYQSLYPDPERQQQAILRMDRMRVGDNLRAEEWEIVRKDGARRIMSISTSGIEIEGNIPAVAALIQDVTTQHQAVQSLRESERALQLFRELISWTNDTFHVIEPATGRFLDVNERACERLGYSRAELLQLGVTDIEVMLPDQIAWEQHLQRMQSARSMLIEGIHRRKDGSTFPVEVNVRYVTVDQQEYMVAVVRDITERRLGDAARQLALDNLRRSEERFSKLFHASPFSINVASYPEGKIVEANSAFLRLFEFELEEVIGKTTGELNIWVHPGDRQQMLDRLRTHGSARDREYRFRTKSGKRLTLVMSVEIIQLDGQDYSLVMSVDITDRKAAEAELHKTDELLRAVVESTTDAVFVKDRQGKYLLFNEAAGRFVGVPAADVIGRDDSTLFDSTTVKVVQDHDRRVMETGLVSTQEETLTAAGVSRTYLSTKAPYRDEAGNVIGLIGISHDISERRRAEQLIRENEERMRLLMDSVPAFISYVDTEERYRWVNQVYEEWYQRPREQILGRTVRELQGEQSYASMQAHIQQALRGKTVHYEHELFSADQVRRTFDTHYIPHRSDDERVLGFFVMVFDLTVERSAQHALRESEERYRKLFETCGDAIFILDLQGQIRSANPAAATMHGYTLDELIGKSIRDLDVPADADQVSDRMQRLQSGETLHFEVMHHRRDGTEFPLDVVATMLQLGDEPLVLSFDRDMTERKRTESALAASERRFRTLIEATNAVTWSCPASGLQIEPQPGWMKLTGQTAEEMLGTGWINAIHPEDLPVVKARWEHAVASGESYSIVYRIRRYDNEWRWMNVYAVPYRDVGGRFIEWVGICFDLTSQKRMEDTLRHILEAIAPTSGGDYFHALVNHLTRACQMDYAFVAAFEQENTLVRTLAVSHQGESVPNFTYALDHTPCENLQSQSICSYPKGIQQLYPEDHLLMTMGIECYLGIPLKSMSGRVIGLLVMLHRTEAQDLQQAETLIQVVARQAAAELERDLAEAARHAALQSLQESETFLRMAQEAARVGSWEWDLQAEHLKWSAELAQIYGTSLEEFDGSLEAAMSYCDPESSARFRKFLMELCAGQVVDGVECRISRRDGTICDLWFVGQVRHDSTQNSDKVLGVAIDITDRKKEEDQRRMLASQLAQAQKLEAIGQLAGGVAHDFNNILTVINGYSKLLQNSTPADDPRSEMLSEISDAGARAATLTQQLLNYSRKQVVDPRVFDMNEAAGEMENLLRKLIGENIQLTLVYSSQAAMVAADPGQVGQVLMNLVVNARDAMPRGGVLTIAIDIVRPDSLLRQAHACAHANNFVQLSVSDTGSGIPEELLERIFEPFFTTKRVGMGTGLGLASVRSIAKEAGGFVFARNNPVQGSTFHFLLPAMDDEPSKMMVLAPKTSHGREKILLVEDENAVRVVLRRFLEKYGYTVLDAAGATEALEIASQQAGAIDLLITDVVMPEISGRELVEKMKSLWPEMKSLYVSGYSTDDVVRHGVLQSQVALLQKPFTPDALATKVREILDHSARSHP